jgi:hypothetical protein
MVRVVACIELICYYDFVVIMNSIGLSIKRKRRIHSG